MALAHPLPASHHPGWSLHRGLPLLHGGPPATVHGPGLLGKAPGTSPSQARNTRPSVVFLCPEHFLQHCGPAYFSIVATSNSGILPDRFCFSLPTPERKGFLQCFLLQGLSPPSSGQGYFWSFISVLSRVQIKQYWIFGSTQRTWPQFIF